MKKKIKLIALSLMITVLVSLGINTIQSHHSPNNEIYASNKQEDDPKPPGS
ncbi:hypothetical protein [Gottfriedia acidiceleris]|uniref:Phr family secreted Rap phosphatase inhibitor n=1 Tax=Gottfriedia acidiceleris TaxID=371036 RepID=A0ABY4JLX1_9BACI|nr:hypothetical protein [Gottfriedia acidiceleris]UPM54840.1 hypothetical protein MY490_02915 [Gottfriedia acidiceleris]